MADIHPQLQNDCIIIGKFKLCHLLLMNDANYPWFILVPDRDDVTEIYQLTEQDQKQLIQESSNLSTALMEWFKGDKLNIAALGNIVPQCHIHHVVRYHDDPAWPKPIWGVVPAKEYNDENLNECMSKIKQMKLEGFSLSGEWL